MRLRAPKVFLSYSHDSQDHLDRVLALSNRLRRDGIDAWLDQYEHAPSGGWPLWAAQQLRDADFVLVICTAAYERRFNGTEHPEVGQGARWEGAIITQEIYESGGKSRKFVPVVYSSGSRADIPLVLRAVASYNLFVEADYWQLYRHLTGQHSLAPELGHLVALPTKDRHTGLFAGPGAPQPLFADERTRLLSRELEETEERLEHMTVLGEDSVELREKALRLRRELREGGRLQAGDILAGAYKLFEPLGRGGFATVWKAYDRRRLKVVAVKVLHASQAEERSRLARFQRGARTMADLRHRGIVRVYEPHLIDGVFHFSVMEHVAGGDLARAVQEGRLPVERVIPLIIEVGEALTYAHRSGIIHRDVKPANILLSDSGPKLSDFDLFWAADSTGGTGTGSVLGTLFYSAPEMLTNAKDAGSAADVYSLGMTTIFALLGRELSLAVVKDPEPVIADLECPPVAKAALSKAVSWEPGDRHASIADFCYQLGRGEVALPIRTGFRPPGLQPPISETPEPQPGAERIHRWGETETILVFVPGGEYSLGSDNAGETARPIHRVRLSSYWIGRYPVTNEQYARFLQANPGVREPSYWDDNRFNGPRQPVVGVSWDEARAYCLWAGLCLPSEAQWEAAARGHEERPFPWGAEEPTPQHANFARSIGQTSPVGDSPRGEGPFGTLDQAGNIWEWCEDAWEKLVPLGWERTPDPVFTRGLPGIRVLRGGAWDSWAWAVAATSRNRDEAILRSWVVGFRCVLPGPLARRFPVDGH